LRQRRSDIPLLAAFFAERFSRQLGKPFNGVAQETIDVLSGYDWPGNIRELQNVIERAVILNHGPVVKLGGDLLSVTSFPAAEASGAPEQISLEEIERRHIGQILGTTAWVIEGPRGAARILGLHPNTLRSRMKKLGLVRGRL
ncbi:MAG TPA: helix-turn-helix domain-containing protein, partial [Bryobacteraceae bacterium]